MRRPGGVLNSIRGRAALAKLARIAKAALSCVSQGRFMATRTLPTRPGGMVSEKYEDIRLPLEKDHTFLEEIVVSSLAENKVFLYLA